METERQPTILVVDDNRVNAKMLEVLLKPRGYAVVAAFSGEEALEKVVEVQPDLILLDIYMSGLDGQEVCRRLRAESTTRFLPVVMITSSTDEEEKLKSIEAGADDFIPKPFNRLELLARVKSLLRVKEYHDTIESQATQLAEWNRVLEERVKEQVAELDRLGRLRRFLSPQVAELIVSSGESTLLETRRREIAVLSCDLRGFTPFVDTTKPDLVMEFLREYHWVLGTIIFEFGGTLEHFEGDGLMVVFNDPVPCPDPEARAVLAALSMRQRVSEFITEWARRDLELGFGVGIAFGNATLGMIGFEGRRDYGAVGTVVNRSARLCSECPNGEILVDEGIYRAVAERVHAEEARAVSLKGFAQPVSVFKISRWTGAEELRMKMKS